MKRFNFMCALVATMSISFFSISCTKSNSAEPSANGLGRDPIAAAKDGDKPAAVATLPPQGTQEDSYYLVSKLSDRALTIVPESKQIEQTDLCSGGQTPSAKADLTIYHIRDVSNSVLGSGTYAAYKIQWGKLNPSSLINQFWDLENSSTANGAPIISWPSREQDNQQFVFVPTGDTDGSYYIRNLATGKYLQIAGNEWVNKTSGAKLEQWGFNASLNQKFFLRKR